MKNKRAHFIIPEHLRKAFMEEENRRRKEADGNPRGIRTKILTEALEEFLGVEPEVKVNVKSLAKSKLKAEPEALVYAMKPGTSYSYKDLHELSGLSRTTLRRLMNDYPQFFRDVDPDSRLRAFELVEKPKRKPKRRKKRRKEYKPNTQMEKTRYARNGLELFDVIEDDYETGEHRRVTVTYVDLGEGRKRQLGRLEDEAVLVFTLADMRDDGLITEDQKEIYFLKYYHEDPKTWKEEYEDHELLKERLSKYDEEQPKVEKILEEYRK